MNRFARTLAMVVLTMIAGACYRRAPSAAPSSQDPAAIRLNNLGVAEMNRGHPAEALALFREAAARDASLFAARMNEGIALLNLQRFEEARTVLLDATQRQEDSARAWYNLGILYRNLAQIAPAIAAFEHVVRVDPGDADALYFLGQLHAQAMRYDQAIVWYRRCLTLDAAHLSAEFGLARAYQLSGNEEEARLHLARFDELTKSGVGKPISLAYGEQGPYSTAEPVSGVDLAPEAFAVRFADATARSGLRVDVRKQSAPPDQVVSLLGAGACFVDFDSDGISDLLLPGGSGGAALFRNTGGNFRDVSGRSGLGVSGETLGCTVGDYDNDGRDDIVLGTQDRVLLYRNQGNGAFRDITSESGIRADGLPLGLVFVDYDHDGDLDLYISRFTNFTLGPGRRFEFPFTAPETPNLLWRNNGNGTFTDWTSQAGLAGDAPGIGALPTDFNNDRAVDFVLTGWRSSAAVLANPREGAFRPIEVWESAFPSAAAGAVAFDINKDGWMDLAFTHWGPPGLSVWRNRAGRGFERLPMADVGWSRGWGIAAIDADNDGWLDLAAVGEDETQGRMVLLRNLGGNQLSDVTKASGLDSLRLVRPRALVAGDVDVDGDSDLIVTQNGDQPILLRNEGGNRRRSLRLALEGLSDNRSGIGTKVEVFAGALRQKWEVPSSSGYLGQSAREIVAGLGDAREADIVRLLWPTGVPQDEVRLAAGNRHLVRELDRRGSSCPVVFVWNGERYEFISDMIGPGIIGEWLGPEERNIPDPTEYLKIDGTRVKPRNGRLSVRLAEVMEEITYLDQSRLLAIDHPSDVVVNPNEYFASQPPFPEFRVVTSRNTRLPLVAVDDRGRDVMRELRSRDGRYVTGFESLPYIGFAKMHYLEMDFGELDPKAPLRLVMHGFTDYFTVTSIFAAHQGDVHAVVPFLEVRSGDGPWTRASEDIGFPAGLARTMIADLTGRIPEGTTRVRIGTNLKIYWDQILIDTTPQGTSVEVTEVPLAAAFLTYRGYPRRVEGVVKGDVSYVYADVSSSGPFARQSGRYTAYGDVLPLLRDADDRFAILGSGDEVALEFDASGLPAVRAGWSRDYFLYADGYAKDMDFYSAYSDTVEPLPFHAMGRYPYGPQIAYPASAAHLDYRLGTNTRDHAGDRRGAASYRFEYPTANSRKK